MKKKNKLLILGIILFAGLSSCENPYDLDDNVRETEINPNPGQNISPTVFEVDSVLWEFYEYTIDDISHYLEWVGYANIKKETVKLDTTDTFPKLWIELEVENTLPDNVYLSSSDKVTFFRMFVDSLIVKDRGTYPMGESYDNNNSWFYVNIKSLINNKTYVYDGNEISAWIELHYIESIGIIEGIVWLNFLLIPDVETSAFACLFTIKYK